MPYDRQLATVRNLENPPRGYNEVREYRVDQIGQTQLLGVKRIYSRDAMKIEYHEYFIIGPRGGIKSHLHTLVY